MTDSEFYKELATAWHRGQWAAMIWQHRHDRGENPDDPKCPYEDGVQADMPPRDADVSGKKIHECSPQPNMCLHVAHNVEASDYWEVRENPGHPPTYYGG